MCRDKALEVLDGLLLGDGGLVKYEFGTYYVMRQSKRTITLEDHIRWEQWVADNVFRVLGIPLSEGNPKVMTGVSRGKLYQYAQLSTLYSPLLADLHTEWYNGGEWAGPPGARYIHGATKVLPERLRQALELPTSTLAHWFIGDGGARQASLSPKIETSFSTYCFSEEEVCHLMVMLGNMGINTTKPAKHVCKKGSGLRILLAQDSVNNLMDLIEPHIIDICGSPNCSLYRSLVKRRGTPPRAPRSYFNPDFDYMRAKLKHQK